jgi:hypothetical protein
MRVLVTNEILSSGILKRIFSLLVSASPSLQRALSELFLSFAAGREQIMEALAEMNRALLVVLLLRDSDSRATQFSLAILHQLLTEGVSSRALVEPHLPEIIKSLKSCRWFVKAHRQILSDLVTVCTDDSRVRDLLIGSNLIPHFVQTDLKYGVELQTSTVTMFLKQCISSKDELLIAHLVDSQALSSFIVYSFLRPHSIATAKEVVRELLCFNPKYLANVKVANKSSLRTHLTEFNHSIE